jgi:WD40 repeat protein
MKYIFLSFFAYVAAAGIGQAVQLAQPEPRLIFGEVTGDQWTIARFSPDGKYILAGYPTKNTTSPMLWDVASGKLIRTFVWSNKGLTQQIRSIGFSADGKHVFACGIGHNVVMWETESGKEIRSFPPEYKFFMSQYAVTPDGNEIVATSCGETQITVFHLPSGKVLRQRNRTGAMETLAIQFAKDGKHFFVQDAFGTAIWDFEKLEERFVFSKLDEQPIKGVATLGVTIAPDGAGVMFCTRDGKIIDIDFVTGKERRSFDLKTRNVYNIAFNSKGDRLLVGCRLDGVARLYSFPECKQLRQVHGFGRVQLSPDGKMALTFTKDGRMTLWDLE